MEEFKKMMKLTAVLIPLALALGIIIVFALNPSAFTGSYDDVANDNQAGSLILESTFGKTVVTEKITGKSEESDINAIAVACDVSGEALEHNFEDGKCTVCGEEESSLEISELSEDEGEN